MAGFTSQDNLINAITTSGKFWRADWNKLFNPTTAATAGQWATLTRGGGNPQADAIFDVGTNLQYQGITDLTASAGCIYHGGNVDATAGAGYKCVLNADAFTVAATSMPAVLMLVDILGFARVTTVTTTTAQSIIYTNTFTASSSSGLLLTTTNQWPSYQRVQFTTTGTLPTGLSLATYYYLVNVSATQARVATSYANAIAGTVIAFTDAGTGTHTLTCYHNRYPTGAGVQTIMFNPAATALGAATPNLSIGYTNSAGTASRATPSTPALPVGTTAAYNTNILYSGTTGSGKYGPFLPLQAGDAGVQSVQNITNSTSYVSGTYTLGFVKPILTLPLTTLGVAAEREFGSMLPSYPVVNDGAALFWLIYNGANTPANSAFYGHIDLGWT